jgi:hypothetical protein
LGHWDLTPAPVLRLIGLSTPREKLTRSHSSPRTSERPSGIPQGAGSPHRQSGIGAAPGAHASRYLWGPLKIASPPSCVPLGDHRADPCAARRGFSASCGHSARPVTVNVIRKSRRFYAFSRFSPSRVNLRKPPNHPEVPYQVAAEWQRVRILRMLPSGHGALDSASTRHVHALAA